MHTGHIILIKADSHQDAIDRVRLYLQPDEGQSPADWSDWCMVGDEGIFGSRYSFRHDYEDWDGASDYAVSLDDEADLFHKVLAKMYGLREQAFDDFRERIFDMGIVGFRLDQNDQESWALYRFSELVESVYNPHSFVYDLQNFTADLKYFRETESEEGWYAVLVDFHF